MAIRMEDEYTYATPADADYPGGSFLNDPTGAGTAGTPLEKAWADDLLGFRDAIMAAAGVGYSGAPDTAQASDALDALYALFVKISDAVSAATPNKVVRRDANGRFKAAAASASDDVAIKSQVDAKAALAGSSGQTFSVATPTSSVHAATKAYVDGQAVGVGQTWQDVSGSRAKDTEYTNSTGRTIVVSIAYSNITGSIDGEFFVGVAIANVSLGNGRGQGISSFIIPPGNKYKYTGNFVTWAELR